MRLDHVSYAAGPEGLAACVQRLGARLGAPFVDGGLHPAFGTRNFVLPLARGCYLEVVGTLDHPAVDTAPFGIAVRNRAAAGGGWMGWAVRVDDLTPVEQRLGRESVEGHRRRPDGVDLFWQQIGINDLAVDPQRPYFVRWKSVDHPSNGGSLSLTRLEIAGDENVVDAYLGVSSSQPLDGIVVQWREPNDRETGIVAAEFLTPTGIVRVD